MSIHSLYWKFNEMSLSTAVEKQFFSTSSFSCYNSTILGQFEKNQGLKKLSSYVGNKMSSSGSHRTFASVKKDVTISQNSLGHTVGTLSYLAQQSSFGVNPSG